MCKVPSSCMLQLPSLFRDRAVNCSDKGNFFFLFLLVAVALIKYSLYWVLLLPVARSSCWLISRQLHVHQPLDSSEVGDGSPKAQFKDSIFYRAVKKFFIWAAEPLLLVTCCKTERTHLASHISGWVCKTDRKKKKQQAEPISSVWSLSKLLLTKWDKRGSSQSDYHSHFTGSIPSLIHRPLWN